MNRGVIKSELLADGKLAIHITSGDIYMTRSEIVALFGVPQQSVIANLRAVFKSGELIEENVVHINNKGVVFYNLDTILALLFRCKGGYCRDIREWIIGRIKQPIIEHRQPIIITLRGGDILS